VPGGSAVFLGGVIAYANRLKEQFGVPAGMIASHGAVSPEVAATDANGILLSPGPGTPDDAGVTLEVIRELSGKLPIFGVCLGHQAIGQAFGARVGRAPELMHGKTSPIEHDGKTIFEGIPCPFEATRYHSLIIEEDSLPDCLAVTARTAKGEIMGVRHRSMPVEGVQFHPESVLTQHGMKLVENWLRSL